LPRFPRNRSLQKPELLLQEPLLSLVMRLVMYPGPTLNE